MSSALGFISRIYKTLNPPTVPKLDAVPTSSSTSTDASPQRPLRFGILGAAAIAPAALIRPALSHPEVLVYAVAARDPLRAAAYAAKHSIPKVYSSYQDLIDDDAVDVVYNPLPNGLHYEWTMKALEKGKHVLLEKPAADRVEEVRAMWELAERKGVVILEAFHYRFHPAILRVKEILDSGELGKVKHVDAKMKVFKGLFPPSDIRFDYDLGGGAMMDMGCYTLNCIRYLTSSNPSSILSVSHRLFAPSNPPEGYVQNVDSATTARLALPNDATAQITADLEDPLILGLIPRLPDLTVTVECEGGKIELYNFVLSSFYHTISVAPTGKSARKEKAYTFKGEEGRKGVKGEPWWETYRYQLEAFVNKVKGREVHAWVEKEDSISNADWIEKIYAEQLGVRPKSTYVHNS